MVTTTTKTLNYSVTSGNKTNSVNATITSTPAFNSLYLKKLPGLLKILELVVTVVAIGLAASRQREWLKVASVNDPGTWPVEFFILGEVFFLCVMSAALTWLFSILVTYLFHIVSSVIIPKTTILEIIMNFLLALMCWTAGIVELAETVTNAWGPNGVNGPPIPLANSSETIDQRITNSDWGCRIAAGSLALFLGTFFFISFILAIQEYRGPKRAHTVS